MSTAICKTNQALDPDMILGNLVFISLGDMKISKENLKKIFFINNLPEYYVRDISPVDAFRRATSMAKGLHVPVTIGQNQGAKAIVEVDELSTNKQGVHRVAGVKYVDKKNKEIGYTPVLNITFDRATNTMDTDINTKDAADPMYKISVAIDSYIRHYFTDFCMNHNKDTVRNIINRIIKDAHPVCLMNTGLCKFTPSTSSDLMYGLKGSLKDLDTYCEDNTHNSMEIIPIVDTDEQRDLVHVSMQDEITHDFQQIMTDMREVLLAKETLSEKTANAYTKKISELKEKKEDYERLLNTCETILDAQMNKALKLIEQKKG